MTGCGAAVQRCLSAVVFLREIAFRLSLLSGWLISGGKLALAEEKSYESYNNMSVCELFDQMLAGKLGRVSEAFCKNAKMDYAQFCPWLGCRAAKLYGC